LKVSTNVKIAMQCFENFGWANAPNAPNAPPPGCAPGWNCYNLSVGIALNVRFTTNGMSAKNTTQTYKYGASKQ